MKRDVAYIRLNTHDPMKRVWKVFCARGAVLDVDARGELVGLEVPERRLQGWGVRLPAIT